MEKEIYVPNNNNSSNDNKILNGNDNMIKRYDQEPITDATITISTADDPNSRYKVYPNLKGIYEYMTKPGAFKKIICFYLSFQFYLLIFRQFPGSIKQLSACITHNIVSVHYITSFPDIILTVSTTILTTLISRNTPPASAPITTLRANTPTAPVSP